MNVNQKTKEEIEYDEYWISCAEWPAVEPLHWIVRVNEQGESTGFIFKNILTDKILLS